MAILAEIGDKVPSIAGTAMLSAVLATVALGLGSLRWWLGAAMGIAVLVLWNLSIYLDVTETTVAPLLAAELGAHYALGRFVAANLPLTIAVTLMVAYQRARQLARARAADGRCADCGYKMGTGAIVCAECGQARRVPD
jgi:hypothetical protein